MSDWVRVKKQIPFKEMTDQHLERAIQYAQRRLKGLYNEWSRRKWKQLELPMMSEQKKDGEADE